MGLTKSCLKPIFLQNIFFAKVSPRTDMRKINTAFKISLYFFLSFPPESVPPSFAPCHPSSSSFDLHRAIARPKHTLTERERPTSKRQQSAVFAHSRRLCASKSQQSHALKSVSIFRQQLDGTTSVKGITNGARVRLSLVRIIPQFRFSILTLRPANPPPPFPAIIRRRANLLLDPSSSFHSSRQPWSR